MGLSIHSLFQKIQVFIHQFLYDYIVNIHKYIRYMYRISYMPVQFIKRQSFLIKFNKIKVLSDGIVDPHSILKNAPIYTSIYMHLYSRYT